MDTPFQPYGTVSHGTAPASVPPGEKVGKFKASMMITLASWSILKKDREMLLFPLLSTIVTLIAAALLFGVYFFMIAGGSIETLRTLMESAKERTSGGAELLFGFAYYLVTYFILIYFQAGVVAIAHARIQGRDLTFRDGMHAASAHAGKLFFWSLVNATVGMVLHLIAERSKIVGRLVVSLLGAAWSILTFFILLVLILEERGIKDSLARSGEVIKKTWGETILVNIGVGLFMFVLTLLGIAVFMAALFTGSGAVVFVALILLLVYIIVLSLVSSTLSVIFKVVLYEYATNGTLPEAFPEQVIRYAFAPQK